MGLISRVSSRTYRYDMPRGKKRDIQRPPTVYYDINAMPPSHQENPYSCMVDYCLHDHCIFVTKSVEKLGFTHPDNYSEITVARNEIMGEKTEKEDAEEMTDTFSYTDEDGNMELVFYKENSESEEEEIKEITSPTKKNKVTYRHCKCGKENCFRPATPPNMRPCQCGKLGCFQPIEIKVPAGMRLCKCGKPDCFEVIQPITFYSLPELAKKFEPVIEQEAVNYSNPMQVDQL